MKGLQMAVKHRTQKERKVLFSARNRKVEVNASVPKEAIAEPAPIVKPSYAVTDLSNQYLEVKCEEDVVSLSNLSSCLVIM